MSEIITNDENDKVVAKERPFYSTTETKVWSSKTDDPKPMQCSQITHIKHCQ